MIISIKFRILTAWAEPVRLSLYVKGLMAYITLSLPYLRKIIFIRNAFIWMFLLHHSPRASDKGLAPDCPASPQMEFVLPSV